MFYRAYLSKDVLRGFDQYRYSCQDTSPLSNYFMHPFWNQVVKLCPRWVAPNLLTFVGFLCCVGHYALPAVYDYDFRASTKDSEHPIPSWAWAATSVLLFLAHTLDGIDGKQARRTQTSTPLGELFDHGLDSWSTVFIASTFYSVFGRNEDGFSIPIFRMYLIVWSVFFVFHITHWEKYNTGIMYLPWSYDIAMLTGTLLYLVTSFIGTEAYKVNLPGGYPAGPLLEIIFYFCSYGLALNMTMYNIWHAYRSGTAKQPNALEGMRPMVSFILAFVMCTAWAAWSPNGILYADPRCFLLMCGTLYANMSCRLIISQMTSTRCELLNWLLLPTAACAAAALFAPGISLSAELALVYVLTALVLAAHVHYCACVVAQMCELLKIRCFSIEPRGGGGGDAGDDGKGEHRLIPTSDRFVDDDDDDDDGDDAEIGRPSL